MDSIDTRQEQRDAHIRSADFFDVGNHTEHDLPLHRASAPTAPTGPSRATSPSRASPSPSPWSWSSTASVPTPTAAPRRLLAPRPRSPARRSASTSTCRWTAAASSSATRSTSSSRSRPCSAPPDPPQHLRRGPRAIRPGPSWRPPAPQRSPSVPGSSPGRDDRRAGGDAADPGWRRRPGSSSAASSSSLGVLKVPDPAAAVRAVRAYRCCPSRWWPGRLRPAGRRDRVGLALLLGVFVRTAAIAVAVLLVVFLVGCGSAWARGLQIDCGCFGNGGRVAAGETAYPVEVLRAAPTCWPRAACVLAAWR